MVSYTNNLKLIQPSSADIVNVSDIASNMITIDKFIGFMQVGTKEEVATPFEGLKIIESSGAAYIYITGQGWVAMGSTVTAGANGRKSYNSYTTNGSTSVGSEVMSNVKSTFTAETGRRYWVEINASLEVAGTDEITALTTRGQCYIRYATGTSVTTSDTIMNGKPHLVDVPFYGQDVLDADCYFLGEFVPNINGNITVGLSYKSLSGSTMFARASSTAPNIILVRDVGT